VILFRAFARDRGAASDEVGGARWIPRAHQGAGRHDGPDEFGCLYTSEIAVSPVAEVLAPFRGTGPVTPDLLLRFGLPIALATLELDDAAFVLDLDDPATLVAHGLRPSQVASGDRGRTQAIARSLYELGGAPDALRWWSTLEAAWINVTIFDRAADRLTVADVRDLTVDDPVVGQAAQHLGLV
jgi:hypothetical protein